MIKKLENLLILSAALGLSAIGLGYGLDPNFYPNLFNHSFTLPEEYHVYRAICGLYFGLSTYWIFSIFKPELKQGAVLSIIAVMLGLLSGRFFSAIADGQSHLLFQFFIALELFVALSAICIYVDRYIVEFMFKIYSRIFHTK